MSTPKLGLAVPIIGLDTVPSLKQTAPAHRQSGLETGFNNTGHALGNGGSAGTNRPWIEVAEKALKLDFSNSGLKNVVSMANLSHTPLPTGCTLPKCVPMWEQSGSSLTTFLC